jgi:iron complex transport system substrate-binding protein
MVLSLKTVALATGAMLLASALQPAATASEPPERIVSINLCADELLISLADPDQIAALSPFSTDQTLSFVAAQARHFRHDASDAEVVVGLNPDLVLAGRFTKLATREMLTRLGYRVVLLDPARSIADSIRQIREIAALVGHPQRGEALIADIEAARAQAEYAAAERKIKLSAAVYQRRGYVTGGNTLSSELMAIVGLENTGAELAGSTGGFVPLEEVIIARPDLLVVASPTITPEDQGSALLAHPALVKLYSPSKRITLPERLTVCGGPSLPAAIDWLAAEIQTVVQKP